MPPPRGRVAPWGPSGGKAGSFGKGKGKGKGPTPTAVAKARAAKVPGATPICDEHRRTGQCTFLARTGRKCEFLHVEKLPPQLSSIEGLISTDLKGYELQFDPCSGVYTCLPCREPQASTNIGNIEAEVQSTYHELSSELDFSVYDAAPSDLGSSNGQQQVFQGHPQ